MKAIEQLGPKLQYHGAVHYVVPNGSSFRVCGSDSKVWPFKRKLVNFAKKVGSVYYIVQGG